MVTKIWRSRVVLAVAVFFSFAGLERDADALAINVPYAVKGHALTAQNGTAGSAVLFNNMFYFAYIAPDGNLAILADSNLGSGGQSVVYSYEIGIQALFGTALVSYNGTLYLFYPHNYSSGNNYLAMITTTDGVHWSQEYFLAWPVDGTLKFSTPPAAVAWEGQILVYLNEQGGSLDQYNVVGTTVSGPYQHFAGSATYSTSRRPSATVWQGRLCLAFSDAANGGEMGMVTYTDATGWTSETLTGSYGIPGIYPIASGGLELVFPAISPNNHIYTILTTDGVTFNYWNYDSASTTFHAAIPFSNWNLSSNWTFYVGENNELFTVLE